MCVNVNRNEELVAARRLRARLRLRALTVLSELRAYKLALEKWMDAALDALDDIMETAAERETIAEGTPGWLFDGCDLVRAEVSRVEDVAIDVGGQIDGIVKLLMEGRQRALVIATERARRRFMQRPRFAE